MIKRLWLRNFKSFGEAEIELRPINVVVGANASGKTNLVAAFRFLRDVASEGVFGFERMVERHGGYDRLCNFRSAAEGFTIGVHLELPRELDWSHFLLQQIGATADALKSDFDPRYELREVRYQLTVEPAKGGAPVQAREDARFGFSDGGEVRWEEGVYSNAPADSPLRLALWARVAIALSCLTRIQVYDFYPRLAKQAVPLSGDTRLSEDGRNLPVVLERLLRDPESRENLRLIAKSVLPYVQDVQVGQLPTGATFVQVIEKFVCEHPVPADMLSDGTLEMLALIVALYFEKKHALLTIFEEPDRHLHPRLMSWLMYMVRDSLGLEWGLPPRGQILITTHDPELVRHTTLDDLLLIERDKDGFSIVKRPAEQQMVKAFLKNKLGVPELHARGLLGV